MLVLTRRTRQSIMIGDDIHIIVTRLGDGKVRLGIEAPPDVKIRRSELDVEEKQVGIGESDRQAMQCGERGMETATLTKHSASVRLPASSPIGRALRSKTSG